MGNEETEVRAIIDANGVFSDAGHADQARDRCQVGGTRASAFVVDGSGSSGRCYQHIRHFKERQAIAA